MENNRCQWILRKGRLTFDVLKNNEKIFFIDYIGEED